jgi:hypothetical protein
MNRISWKLGSGLFVSGIIIALSVFFGVVGVPYTGVSVTETLVASGQSSQTTAFVMTFVPVQLAVIPLLAGATVMAGLVRRVAVVCWAGTILLLGFCFVGLFSIGLLYLPLAIVLVGLLPTTTATTTTATTATQVS